VPTLRKRCCARRSFLALRRMPAATMRRDRSIAARASAPESPLGAWKGKPGWMLPCWFVRSPKGFGSPVRESLIKANELQGGLGKADSADKKSALYDQASRSPAPIPQRRSIKMPRLARYLSHPTAWLESPDVPRHGRATAHRSLPWQRRRPFSPTRCRSRCFAAAQACRCSWSGGARIGDVCRFSSA